ncbi:carbohydrate binding domain-containing protein [Chengkuizengella axinellae]|uniref:Carbohydrate binding domain-containing protein n=1 Tax=Chengkuizengella axinellae TaxID=3064388 RepID=A0ABT9J0L4_9BACL|nr:carbohydrate binding domain-containing protein [Chengkuizengella sp. 2205SS18-9]MDP5275155.1 carbohydrate binding domain-containing protein [Chengkuizengella sp. 2205SS18-9]
MKKLGLILTSLAVIIIIIGIVFYSTQNSDKSGFQPKASKGKTHGTTAVSVDFDETIHHLAVQVSSEPFAEPTIGEVVSSNRTVTNSYTPGEDISGVDGKTNKYLGVFLVDDNNKIVDFKEIKLSNGKVQTEKWSLVWEDDFEDAQIDESKWNFIQGGGGYGNHELQNYTNRSENARIEDGSLVIEAHEENFGAEEYTSAKLTTEGKGDWKYGRFEIRAKSPEGQGIWPAIWMMPTDYQVYNVWPSSGEIDIFELVGHDPYTVHGTLHYGSPHTYTGESYQLPNGEKFSDDYHTYTIEWEPGEIRWYVDDVLFSKQNDWFSKDPNNPENYTYPAPYDREFYLQLNLAVGGDWPGYPDETTVFPQQFLIDYVRVYELDGEYREAGARPEPSPYATETTGDAREPLEDGNFVYNGGFDEELTNWDFQPYEPKTQFGGEGEVMAEEGELHTDIQKRGEAPWAIQLVQTQIPMVKNERYTISFDARSTGNREMMVNVSGPDRNFSRYFQDTNVALNENMQHFEFTFDMIQDSDMNARVEFNMGQFSDLPVWVDNVKLVKKEKDPNETKVILPTGNYVYNGTFDQGDQRLAFWELINEDGADAAAAVGVNLEEREFEISISEVGASPESVRFVQTALNMEKGKTYLLSFDSRAAEERSIDVRMTNETENTIHASKSFNLSTESQTYNFVFKMENDTDTHAQLQFLFGNQSSAAYLDNVILKELLAPTVLEDRVVIRAKEYYDMSGVVIEGETVGFIEEGDWMQYVVDVKDAGDYKVTYYAASELDNGQLSMLVKPGSVFTENLAAGEVLENDASYKTTMQVKGTGGWQSYKLMNDSITLDAGVQTIQIYAPNVNLHWFSIAKVE